MRILGGHTIDVYRAGRDRFGDKVDESLIGSIDHVVFQFANATSVGLRFHPNMNFQETSGTSAMLFIPKDSEPRLQARDRIKIFGNTYQVVGDPAWDENHPMTGYDFGFYMMQVEVED